MAAWRQELKDALAGVKSNGKFAVTGVVDGPRELAVRGVGSLAIPLSKKHTKDLVAAGAAAPYGKGAATVLDPAVRKGTQIEAERVSFPADWAVSLERLAVGAAAALGQVGAGAVEARLYKLLVYERGGHFKIHRDTEKEPGMFGTLLVQLPVAGGHTGGRLTVRHLGQEVAWDTAAAEAAAASDGGGGAAGGGGGRGGKGRGAKLQQQPQQQQPQQAPPPALRYAAFYADCEHELAKVEAGLRVVLAYNLVRVAPPPPPPPPQQQQQQQDAAGAVVEGGTATNAVTSSPGAPAVSAASVAAITAAVQSWEAAGADGNGDGDGSGSGAVPPLVLVPLCHKYTATNLGFGGLKGDDGAKVQALLGCSLLDVHLVLITKYVTGSAVDGPGCRYKRSRKRKASSSFWGSDDENCDDPDTAVMLEELDWRTQVEVCVSPLFGRLTGGQGDDLMSALLVDGDAGRGNGSGLLLHDEHRVFPKGLAPDEREYAGWTGNAGPELHYWYHRAVAVVWPRSRRAHLSACKPGDLGDTIALAKQLLGSLEPQQRSELASDSDIKGDGDAVSERAGGAAAGGGPSAAGLALTPLQQYLQRLEALQPHHVDKAARRTQAQQALAAALGCAVEAAADADARRGGSSAITSALALLRGAGVARLCGEPWRRAACLRLLRSIRWADPAAAARQPSWCVPAGVGLDDAGLQGALASTAAELGSDEFDDELASVLAQLLPRQLQGCACFAANAALPPALRARLLQVFRGEVFAAGAAGDGGAGAVPPNAAAAKVADAAAAAALAVGGSAGTRAGAGAGAITQMPLESLRYLASLVFAAEDDTAAAAGGGGGSGGGGAGPFSDMAGAFSAAVLRRPDCQTALLPALLQEPAVRRALSARPRQQPAAVELALARARYLQPRVPSTVPRDYCMPDVSSKDAAIVAFLTSPQRQERFIGFKSIADARLWAHDLKAAAGGGSLVAADARGTGRDAFVMAEKGEEVRARRAERYKEEAKELVEVMALLGPAAPAAAAVAAPAAAAPTPSAAPAAASQAAARAKAGASRAAMTSRAAASGSRTAAASGSRTAAAAAAASAAADSLAETKARLAEATATLEALKQRRAQFEAVRGGHVPGLAAGGGGALAVAAGRYPLAAALPLGLVAPQVAPPRGPRNGGFPPATGPGGFPGRGVGGGGGAVVGGFSAAEVAMLNRVLAPGWQEKMMAHGAGIAPVGGQLGGGAMDAVGAAAAPAAVPNAGVMLPGRGGLWLGGDVAGSVAGVVAPAPQCPPHVSLHQLMHDPGFQKMMEEMNKRSGQL